MSWKQLPIPFLGMMGLNSSQGERDYEPTGRDTVANPRATETPVSTKRKRDAPSPGESPIFEQPAKRKPPPKIVKYQRSSNSTPTPQPDGQPPSEGSGGSSSVPASDAAMSSEASSSQQTTAKRRGRSGAKKKEETAHFQPGHVSRTNAKHTGFFSPDEVRTLEQFKVDFCNENNITPELFDRLVQDSRKNRDGRLSLEGISRTAFWQSVYNLLPQRDRRSVYRFMRRHFQASSQKPHQWTKEQDDELEQMHAQYGPKWAKIARELGRTQDDVVQRWKNHVEHRRTLKWGPWSDEEIEALQNALRHSWTALHDSGVDVGKDIYEMDESLISWGVVSNMMNNTRSRQQCADRWRKIKRAVLEERRAGNPDAVYRPGARKPRRKREDDSDQPSKRRSNSSRTMKSKERVSSEDLESDNSDRDESERPAVVKEEGNVPSSSSVDREMRAGEPSSDLGQGDQEHPTGPNHSEAHAESSERETKGQPEEVVEESNYGARQPSNPKSGSQKGSMGTERESTKIVQQSNTTSLKGNGEHQGEPSEKASVGSDSTPGSGSKSGPDLSTNAPLVSGRGSTSSSGSESESESDSGSDSDSDTDSDTSSDSDSDTSDSDSDSSSDSDSTSDSESSDPDSDSSSASNSISKTDPKTKTKSESDSTSDSDSDSDSDSVSTTSGDNGKKS
ncbi:hypothetical protein VTN31DRAFT_3921 [Thermomyces dupontii]|uniref:uncharacterized protein n=1 Tax=Talaromyces thermophilus TaxID=28565 RepID=UPI0037430A82